jgi:hypothetical protein
MDKICRNSAVGQAHSTGSWLDLPCSDTANTARGRHVTGCSYKLENTSPRPDFTNGHSRISDTFKSQEWFRHDRSGPDPPSAMPQFSPRFHRDARGHSPAPAAEKGMTFRSKSYRSLGKEGSAEQQGPTRAKSVGMLGVQFPDPYDVEVFTMDGARSPRDGMRSPRSPRNGFPRSPPAAGQRGRDQSERDDPSQAQARSRSPTYDCSDDWMSWTPGPPQQQRPSLD